MLSLLEKLLVEIVIMYKLLKEIYSDDKNYRREFVMFYLKQPEAQQAADRLNNGTDRVDNHFYYVVEAK